MTPEQILARVAVIAKMDSERAHASEDALRGELLEWFAEAAPEPFRSAARAALTSDELPFSRWYA